MSIVFISKTKDPGPWVKSLKAIEPEITIQVHGNVSRPEEIEFALAWNHEPGDFDRYPNLKVICSMGAGVDHLFKDTRLPERIKICRIFDEQLVTDMNEFVTALIFNHLKNLNDYKIDNVQKIWQPKPYLSIKDSRIGIMGLGQLGKKLAIYLTGIGFKVSGWSANPKTLKEVETFHGNDQLKDFLAKTNILICLLPLTSKTHGILNKQLFLSLPKGAFLINVARGGHLVETDLAEMVENGHLSGASLDVFNQEPLPEDHFFWKHPKIHITPHIASITDPASVAPQVIENYKRMKAGKSLLNEVSREKEY